MTDPDIGSEIIAAQYLPALSVTFYLTLPLKKTQFSADSTPEKLAGTNSNCELSELPHNMLSVSQPI